MIFFIAHALCMGIMVWIVDVYIMLKYSHFTDLHVYQGRSMHVYVIKVLATNGWPTLHVQVNHL